MKIIFRLFMIFSLISCQQSKDDKVIRLEGQALGTSFHITYADESGRNFENEIDDLIHDINRSLSTYIEDSDISKINKGDTTILVDEYFKEVYQKSKRIFKETNGAFDPTIGIVVNAWGFGPEKEIIGLDTLAVSHLLQNVGLDKTKIFNGKLVKENKDAYLDFNAIAKGYTVDVIGRFLEEKRISDYLVEIGGEVRTRGINMKKVPWKIAIEKPNFDGTRSYQKIITLQDESIATSGNYRKFKIDEKTGEKYAHTIDTKTGFPSKSNLLSASVISTLDCADVDAYATAFMALGLEDSKKIALKHPELKVFLVYSNSSGEIETYQTENFSSKN